MYDSIKDEYIDHLIGDIFGPYTNAYIGGGDIFKLTNMQLTKLLREIKVEKQFSVELDAQNLDEEKLMILKEFGVNRICLRSFDSAFEMGFKKLINLGFKDISLEVLGENVGDALTLNPTHLSIYYEGNDYYDLVDEIKRHGFSQYEISNFSKLGYESNLNLIYYNYLPYVGVGLGAGSHFGCVRTVNTWDMNDYLNGNRFSEVLYLNREDYYFERLMAKLHLTKGISEKDPAYIYFKNRLDHTYLKRVNGYISLKDFGHLDTVLLELI